MVWGSWVKSPKSILWSYCEFQLTQYHLRISEPRIHVCVCVCTGHLYSPCILQTYSWQMYCLWIRFPGLHFFYFDLFHWFLMSRCFLGDFGESFLSISWEEGSQRHICVCMHICIEVPCVIYIYTPTYAVICMYVHLHLYLVCICSMRIVGLCCMLQIILKSLRMFSRQ